MTAPSRQPDRRKAYNKEYAEDQRRRLEQELKQSHREVFLDTENGGQGEIL